MTEEVEASIRAVREHLEVSSATVVSYDPSFDREERVWKAGIEIVRLVSS